MEPIRDLAIVLRTTAFQDRHRIVTALTENFGLVSGMARNAIQSRRFGGSLDPFVAAEWSFIDKPGADLLRIEEATVRRSYEGFRGDFERLTLASVMNEIMIKVAPAREACPDLFRLHANALAYLEDQALKKAPPESLSLLNGYITKVLQWSGNQPQLSHCMGCGLSIDNLSNEQSLTCVVADAGWVCVNCRKTETHHVQERRGQSFSHSSIRISPAAKHSLFIIFLVLTRHRSKD
ncbi:unnamed protein product [Sphagnum jensenii]|uniref:DNA repair protein RecO n=1 Tax=Sphagnum jensenii TaxID=128206 RepID=A0ABP0VBN2_9BRYO